MPGVASLLDFGRLEADAGFQIDHIIDGPDMIDEGLRAAFLDAGIGDGDGNRRDAVAVIELQAQRCVAPVDRGFRPELDGVAVIHGIIQALTEHGF